MLHLLRMGSDESYMSSLFCMTRGLLALAALCLFTSVLVAQGVNVSVAGTPRPGATISVTVSGASAAAISADVNGVPISSEYMGPRVLLPNGKIEQRITIPAGATGTINITVTTPSGVVTTSVPISAADG